MSVFIYLSIFSSAAFFPKTKTFPSKTLPIEDRLLRQILYKFLLILFCWGSIWWVAAIRLLPRPCWIQLKSLTTRLNRRSFIFLPFAKPNAVVYCLVALPIEAVIMIPIPLPGKAMSQKNREACKALHDFWTFWEVRWGREWNTRCDNMIGLGKDDCSMIPPLKFGNMRSGSRFCCWQWERERRFLPSTLPWNLIICEAEGWSFLYLGLANVRQTSLESA